jgi:hypothetical protein
VERIGNVVRYFSEEERDRECGGENRNCCAIVC